MEWIPVVKKLAYLITSVLMVWIIFRSFQNMSERAIEFWKAQFDKVIALSLVLGSGWIAAMFFIWDMPERAQAWSQNGFSIFTGLLAGLVTGRALQRAADARNGIPPTKPLNGGENVEPEKK